MPFEGDLELVARLARGTVAGTRDTRVPDSAVLTRGRSRRAEGTRRYACKTQHQARATVGRCGRAITRHFAAESGWKEYRKQYIHIIATRAGRAAGARTSVFGLCAEDRDTPSTCGMTASGGYMLFKVEALPRVRSKEVCFSRIT